MKIFSRINFKMFFIYLKKMGLKKTLILCIHKIISKGTSQSGQSPFPELLEVFDVPDYKSRVTNSVPVIIAESDRKNIPFVWYVPHWSNVWGGGHLTIFRFAHFLSQMGHHNYIYIYNDNGRNFDAKVLKATLDIALPGNTLTVITSPKNIPVAPHLAFATTWQSAYEVIKYSLDAKKFYFMQDYESYFYAFGTQSLQANASYQLGFHGITGGTWLKKCYESHGGTADNYIFSVDPKCFYARPDIGSQIKRLFFYGRPSTERRAYELGIRTLEAIHKKYPDIEIVIAGLDGLDGLSFPAKLLGNLSLAETGNLYRTCDVGFALSATNLSYLPVELMACGVPVITNSGPNVEWFCQNLENSMVCDPLPSSFVAALDELINSEELRLRLARNGLEKISQTSWENEAKKIFGFIHKAMDS